jgi:hypothetical protein
MRKHCGVRFFINPPPPVKADWTMRNPICRKYNGTFKPGHARGGVYVRWSIRGMARCLLNELQRPQAIGRLATVFATFVLALQPIAPVKKSAQIEALVLMCCEMICADSLSRNCFFFLFYFNFKLFYI